MTLLISLIIGFGMTFAGLAVAVILAALLVGPGRPVLGMVVIALLWFVWVYFWWGVMGRLTRHFKQRAAIEQRTLDEAHQPKRLA